MLSSFAAAVAERSTEVPVVSGIYPLMYIYMCPQDAGYSSIRCGSSARCVIRENQLRLGYKFEASGCPPTSLSVLHFAHGY